MWFRELLSRLDVPDPDTLSLQLLLLVDGAIAGALVRGEPKVARAAREAARVLLSAAGVPAAVSITSLSDWGFQQFPGVFIDDIEVSTGEGTTSFETGMDGWSAPGAPPGSSPNANDVPIASPSPKLWSPMPTAMSTASSASGTRMKAMARTGTMLPVCRYQVRKCS